MTLINTLNDTSLCTKRFSKNKSLFLDRDGIININHGYVFRIEDIEFVQGIFDLTAAAFRKGYRIFIVTNQSGIARNYYSALDFNILSQWLEHQFWKRGIKISHTYHCPHYPDFSHACVCRKPRPGMVFKASRQFRASLTHAIMVGDSISDVTCAQRAGIRKRVLFKPDLSRVYGTLTKPGKKPYFITRNLRAIKALL